MDRWTRELDDVWFNPPLSVLGVVYEPLEAVAALWLTSHGRQKDTDKLFQELLNHKPWVKVK